MPRPPPCGEAGRFVYVLRSAQAGTHFYIGLTSNVAARVSDHNDGRCAHTARHRPWELHVEAEGVLLVAIVETHPKHLDGPWIDGFVLDRHVISSRPIGYAGEHMQFETTRSPLGELLYQLKYRNAQVADIVETAVAFVTEQWGGSIDCVVPPPPSLHRTSQPAVLIAEGIAQSLGVPTLSSAAVKATATQQMKNVPLMSARRC